MKRFTISRDDRYHEGWPSICQATNGDLVCSYAEADQHGGGAVPSAVVRVNSDEGCTWSEPIIIDPLMDRLIADISCAARIGVAPTAAVAVSWSGKRMIEVVDVSQEHVQEGPGVQSDAGRRRIGPVCDRFP